jgi:thiosulfate/3-mercaptopyruvate sulfurtransferase
MPYAARAWWLLRWLGHGPVAVLDGGRGAWLAAAARSAPPAARPAVPRALPGQPHWPPCPASTADELLARRIAVRRVKLLDARAGERFRGEVEPLDPVAGHIPGARTALLQGQPRRRRPLQTRPPTARRLRRAGRHRPDVVQQCGSGVTACHNLLAMAHAGLGLSTLYAGLVERVVQRPIRPVAVADARVGAVKCDAPSLQQGATLDLRDTPPERRIRIAPRAGPHNPKRTHHVQAHPGSDRRFGHHRQGREVGHRDGQA